MSALGSPPEAATTRDRLLKCAPYIVMVSTITGSGWLLAPLTNHHVSADGVSYLNIARHWAEGRYPEALNAYWSPLLSWLVAPLLKLGMEPLAAGRLATQAGAMALALLGWRLALRLPFSSIQRWLLLPCFCAVGALWGSLMISADPVSGALLLALLAAALQPGFWGPGWQGPLLVGAFGALAYYAKAYNLGAVPLALALVWAQRAWGKPWRVALRLTLRPVLAGLLCGFLVLPWALALGHRYGSPTLSTAGRFNYGIIRQHQNKYPHLWVGLLPPPSPNATSAWEEISQAPMPAAVAQAPSLGHGYTLLTNFKRLANAAFLNGWLWAWAPMLLAFWLRPAVRRWLWLPLAFSGVYLLGYTWYIFEARYVWGLSALWLALGGAAVIALLEKLRTAQVRAVALGLWAAGATLNMAYQPAWELVAYSTPKFNCPASISLANTHLAAHPGLYNEGLFLAFEGGATFMGALPPDTAKWQAQLRTHQVHFVLVPATTPGRAEAVKWVPAAQALLTN